MSQLVTCQCEDTVKPAITNTADVDGLNTFVSFHMIAENFLVFETLIADCATERLKNNLIYYDTTDYKNILTRSVE